MSRMGKVSAEQAPKKESLSELDKRVRYLMIYLMLKILKTLKTLLDQTSLEFLTWLELIRLYQPVLPVALVY